MDKLIIGISGKKQSGKNTMCDCLHEYFIDKYSRYDVDIFSFADALKNKVCKDVLGLTEEQVNGTDEQKETLTNYKWKNLPQAIRNDKQGVMTAREIMQIVGTNIFRNYFDDSIWVNATMRDIEKSNNKVALISDVRFPSEVNSLLNNNAYVIRLLRDVCETDSHPSETALDNFNFDHEKCIIFDNRKMNIEEQNNATVDLLRPIVMEKIKNIIF